MKLRAAKALVQKLGRTRVGRDAARPARVRDHVGYKDVLLLIAGVIIGVASGLMTSVVQGHFQQRQLVYEKQFLLLREALELTNEYWRESEETLLAAQNAFHEAESALAARPEADEFGPTQYLDAIAPGALKLDAAVQELDRNARLYESKVRTRLSLLQLTFGGGKREIAINMIFRSYTLADLILRGYMDAYLRESKLPKEFRQNAKLMLDKFVKNIEGKRTQLAEARDKVNRELERLGQDLAVRP